MAVDPPRMRRGEDFLGGDVGVAGDAVFRSRTAALPFMPVGKSNREVGAGSGEMQRSETLPVQPLPALTQDFVVSVPRCDSIIPVDAGRREDGIRKLGDRRFLFISR